jgi:hypothetical protein
MSSSPWKYHPATLALCIAGLILPLCAQGQAPKAAGGEKPAAAAKAAASSVSSEAEAKAMLMRMAQFLSKAQRFSVVVRGSYDAVQQSGEKVEFGENRKVTLSRPENRLRVEGEHSDGTKVLTVFNGKEITLVDSRSNVYATAPQSGSLDDTIVHFVRDLGVRLPLAAMLLSRLPAEFEERVRSVDYIEKTSIYGAPAHHVLARTDTVDFQVWITEGDRPLPQRVALTYREAPGEPQFRAQLSDWNFAPAISDATFSAAVPKGAQKVAFVGQLVRDSGVAKQSQTDKSKGGK